MGKYISTDFFRCHSRIDAENDEYLEQCIEAAEATLANDLQVDSLDEVAVDGQLPANLVQAVLMLAGTSYENRETESPVQMHPDFHYWHLISKSIKYK